MIRRAVPVLLTLGILSGFVATLVFLYRKSEARPVVFQTAAPAILDIVKKTVAPGAIVPRREVAIKPRVSGIIEKLYVQPGDFVKDKALVAKIEIVPNMVNLNAAEANLNAAQINFENAKKERDRFQQLFEQKLISETDFVQHKLAFDLRQQELDAAGSNLQLVKEGASRKSGKVSNLVHSTVDGMVLEVPVREGASVIEANTFNEGTTLASIADMNDMIFDGRVDESEVGKLKEGMPVTISVGALGEQWFHGKLEYIAPKGVEKEGTIEFQVKAAVELKSDVFLRANYSANADIIFDRRSQVLAIDEGLVKFEKSRSFVEIETAPQHFEKREVELGLSDGVHVEVKSGVGKDERIKKPESEGGERKGAK
jgi:HlyD family secretion protein